MEIEILTQRSVAPQSMSNSLGGGRGSKLQHEIAWIKNSLGSGVENMVKRFAGHQNPAHQGWGGV